jgi:hypothetical protein
VKRAETDVARPIVNWLGDLQWDVYQEVQCSGPRADIVALQGPLIWVVEVKTTLTFDVMEQAYNWLDHAHYVSIAVPWARTHRSMAQRVCRTFGIGMLEVEHLGGNGIHTRVPAKLGRSRVNRRWAELLRSSCRAECKTWGEAGNARSEFYSPFKGTCRAIVEYLTKHGPSSVKEVVKGIEHHYATDNSARGCIPRWVAYKKVPGVELDTSVRPVLLRLIAKPAKAVA